MSNPPPPPKRKRGKPAGAPQPGIAHRIKAAKLVKSLLAGQTPQQAAAIAGYTPGSVYEAIKRPYVQSLLTDAIARAGITLDDLAAVVHQGLTAVKVMNTKKGPIVLADQPDFDARYGAYDRITQAMGLIPHRTEMPGATAPGLTVNISQAGAKTITAEGTVESPPTEPLTLNIQMRPSSS